MDAPFEVVLHASIFLMYHNELGTGIVNWMGGIFLNIYGNFCIYK